MRMRRRTLLQATGGLVFGNLACGESTALVGTDDFDYLDTDPVEEVVIVDEPGPVPDPDPEVDPEPPPPDPPPNPPPDPPPPDPSTYTLDLGLFPLGVMAGDMTSSSAILWTQCTGTALPLLRVLELTPAGKVVATIWDAPILASELGDGGFVHVDLKGLKPATRYQFRFLVDPTGNKNFRTSRFGFFRTALAAGSRAPVTFAGVCCTNPVEGDRSGFECLNDAATRTDLSFMLHVGDHVYADHAETRAQYRVVYSRQWQRSGMNRVHRSVGFLEMWDDHEVRNNWTTGTVSAARLTAARGAAFEHRPLRRNAAEPNRWWRSFKQGDTLEVFLLDVRSERNPGTQFMSQAQLSWLKKGLKASTAVFKFVVSGVPISDIPGAHGTSWGLAARSDVCDFILRRGAHAATGLTAAQRRGVFFLGGDIHMAYMGRVGAVGTPYAALREMLIGPGGAAEAGKMLGAFTGHVGPGKQYSYVLGTNNYTVLTCTPDASGTGGSLNVQYVGISAAGARKIFHSATYTL
jgi:phosphodiesterase/alkaline phosphatase D-like protein